MPFILQPSTKEHALQCAKVQMASNAGDPLYESVMGNTPAEVIATVLAEEVSNAIGTPGVKVPEIIDSETGKVVAFAKWKYPTAKDPSSQEGGGFEKIKLPEGINMAAAQAVFNLFGEIEKKHLDPETMYSLVSMHVHPEYQRRGLGRRLMEEAVLDADKHGARCHLCASEAGKHLYLKVGFKDVEDVWVYYRNTTVMAREPQPVRV